MALADTLGWLADLVAQHLYRDDVPQPQRRRWSLDGDGFDVVDDDANEVLRISLTEAGGGSSGNVPSPTDEGSILSSLDGTTVTWETELQLGSDPATVGEVRMSRLSGIYTRDSGVDIRYIDASSGPIRVGDAAKNLSLVGIAASFDLAADGLILNQGGDEIFSIDRDVIAHSLDPNTSLWNEYTVGGRATGITGTTNVARFEPGVTDAICNVIADFALYKDDESQWGTGRLIATFKVVAGVVTQVGSTTTVHDQESASISTLTITTDGSEIFATVTAAAATTLIAAAKLHVEQLTI